MNRALLLFTLAILGAGPAAAAPWLPDELGTGFGLLSSGFQTAFTTQSDLSLAQLLVGRTTRRWLTLEGDAFVTEPVYLQNVGTAVGLTLRAGWTGERVSVRAGPSLQWTQSGRPMIQVLPSLRADVRLDPVTLCAGIFDLHGLAPAHLSVRWRYVEAGYVAPLGARAQLQLPIVGRWSARAEGLFVRIFNGELFYGSVGVGFALDGGYP